MPPAPDPSDARPVGGTAAETGRRTLLLLLVMLGGVLLAAALAVGIAHKRGAFAPTVQLYALVDNAAGLAPGTAVRMSGVRVGEVRDLQLMPDLSVRMALRVDADLMPSLRSDARAVLVREQLRPPVVELEPGNAPMRLDPRDPKIAFRGKSSLTEIADELRGRLIPILDDLKQVTGMLRQRQGDVAEVLGNAAKASAELAGSAAEVHALSSSARQRLDAIGAQTQSLLGQGNASVAKVGGLIDQVNASLALVNGALPGLLSKADGTLDNLNAVARSSRQIADSAAQTVPGLLRSAPPMVDEVQDLVTGVKRSWPLRSLLPAPVSPELPIESHDAKALREPPTAAPR